jgi:hypothetical protein
VTRASIRRGREPLQADERETSVTLDTDTDALQLDARCGALAAAWQPARPEPGST